MGFTLGANPRAVWKTRMGIEAVLDADLREMGDDLEVIMGHLTVRVLVRRELLTTLAGCYTFARAYRGVRRRSWAFVRRELAWPSATSARLGTARWGGGAVACDAESVCAPARPA